MLPYIFCSLSIFALGNIKDFLKNKSIKKLIGITILTILIIIAGCRGAFTSDYNNYISIFNQVKETNINTLFGMINSQEIGFLLLTKFLSLFCSANMYMFFISALTIMLIFITFRKMSTNIWISFLLFVGIGSYYAMFNISRMILSVAIISLGYKYIKDGAFLKYLIIVLISMLFHTTAIVMIPMYFLLRKKMTKLYLFLVLLISIFVIIFAPKITQLASVIIHRFSSYTSDYYGMSKGSIGNALVPFLGITLALFIYYLVPHKEALLSNEKAIFLNSCFYYGLFALCSLKIYMLIRFTYYFEIFLWFYIPFFLSKLNKKTANLLKILILIICVFVPIYVLWHSAYNPYYFFWEG